MSIALVRCAALVSAVVTTACVSSMDAAPAAPEFGPERELEAAADDLNGVWASVGYGRVFEIAPGLVVDAYDITPTTCIQSDEDEPLSTWYDTVTLSSDGAQAIFRFTPEPYPYRFGRIDAVPERCVAATDEPASPSAVLDAFSAYFETHYPFFDLYGVDWDARMAEARAAVHDDLDGNALFDVLVHALRGVNDAHVELVATIDDERRRHEAYPAPTEAALRAAAEAGGGSAREAQRAFQRGYWQTNIRDDLLSGAGEQAGANRISHGLITPNIGYLAMVTVAGFTDEVYETELDAVTAALEPAFAAFKRAEVEAVIVDLSINYGGYDYISRAVAGRFTDTASPAYTKQAMDDPRLEPETVMVEPASGSRFTGPVYVITSDVTVSGGETLTLALRALENVTHVGQRTRGALSDMLFKTLPNGWRLSLSNEEYRDQDGVLWEARGIEPHHALPVFVADAPLESHVAAVRAVVEMIDADVASAPPGP